MASERLRAWGIGLGIGHIVLLLLISNLFFPESFGACVADAVAVTLSVVGFCSQKKSEDLLSFYASVRLAAGTVLVGYLTVADPLWSSSGWTLPYHVWWLVLGHVTVNAFDTPNGGISVLAMLSVSVYGLISSDVIPAFFAAASSSRSPVTVQAVQAALLALEAFLLQRVASSEPKMIRPDPATMNALRADLQAKVAMRPGRRDVECYDDNIFSEMRRRAGIRDDFLNDGLDFDLFKPGGGKGGTLMARVGDSFIVKELSDGDHAALSEITSSYFDHVTKGESLLTIIYLHFRDPTTNKKYMVMNNCLGKQEFTAVYDLKGCADDKTLLKDGKEVPVVRKRIWNVWMWGGSCMWSPARVDYHNGKRSARAVRLPLERSEAAPLLKALKRDTDWLAELGLMDYSLLMATRKNVTDSDLQADKLAGRRFFLHSEEDHSRTAIYVGVIDFLQQWTTGKAVAFYVKALEQNKATIRPRPYADRFYRHFVNVFKPTEHCNA